MSSEKDFPARGKIVTTADRYIVFAPYNTTYMMHLAPTGGAYNGPMNSPIECVIHCTARKVWSVPSGGNFVVPIFGSPKIVQGRVKYISGNTMVVQAGTSIVITLPADDTSYDLINGGIGVGTLVNATILPGATLELVEQPAAIK